ncbi:hypothetical protein [Cohnella sp. 56]|uniref:hypothetical protein n=1 Tax=Cohnella sp. 56 TaxID=3113722 RepID=UPI0030E87E37
MTRYVGIDPSTKTGLVILDKHGELIDAVEITAEGKDPSRMIDIIEQVMSSIEDNDFVTIEGFGFASQSGFLLGGIGWGIRMDLYSRRISYDEVAPNALKKFAGAKGNVKKDELAVHIYKRWGFEHASDNVRDAYVLAQIARTVREAKRGYYDGLTAYQKDVVDVILTPPVKKPRKKRGA